MADWKKLLVENPPASDIASSPSSGKVLKVSSNGTGLEWADDAGGAFSDNGTTASVTNRVITAIGTGSNIPTLDLLPNLTSGTIARIRVQTSGKDLRFNLRNQSSTYDVMTIAHNNRVGIGTTSPNESLEVAGSIRATSSNSYVDVIDTDSSLKMTMRGGNTIGAIGTYSNHPLSIRTDTTERIHITSNGQVGIGDSPSQGILELTASSDPVLNLNKTSGGNNAIHFEHAGIDKGYIYVDASNNMKFGNGVTNPTMTIIANGNIGIGTSSPSSGAKLHVIGSNSNNALKIQGGGSVVGMQITRNGTDSNNISTTGSNLIFGTGGSTRMMLTNSGLGIGTTDIDHKLDVHGNIRFTNSIYSFEDGTGRVYQRKWFDFGSGHPTYQTGADDKFHKFQNYSGTNIMVVGGSNNRVGIGINSPQATLHTFGSTGLRLESNHQSNTASLQFKSPAGSSNGGDAGGQINVFDSTGNARIQHTMRRVSSASNGDTVGDYPYEWWSSNADGGLNFRMKLNRTGLGVGTQNPTEKLHVNGSLRLADNKDLIWSNGTRIIGQSNYIQIQTGSVDAIRIDSSQRVGIGTNSPSQLLHIEGSSFPTALIKGGSSGSVLRLQGANNDSVVFNDNTADKWFLRYQPGVNKIDFYNAGLNSSALTILDSNNNIGIGTTSPVYGLDVRSTGYFATASSVDQLRLGDTTNGKQSSIRSVNDTMQFKPDGSNTKFFIGNTGKIGIGTTSPSRSLHIAGTGTEVYGRISNSGTNSYAGLEFVNDAGSFTIGIKNDDKFAIANHTSFGGGYAIVLDGLSRISLSNNDAGTSNTIFGKRAGEDIGGSGNYNVLFGEFAGANISTGDGNVAIGFSALFEANDDGRNTAIGQETLKKYNASGDTYNVAIGHRSQYERTGGVQNTALGAFSQYGATSGTAPTGSGNTSIGYLTLNNITSGQYNSTLGLQAGHSITTSVYNTYSGYQTGYYNETGSHNVAIGGKAMFGASGQSHSNNTAVGYEALKSITTGSSNVAIGKQALDAGTIVTSNVAIGAGALSDNVSGNYNTAVGQSCLLTNIASFMTAVGYNALRLNLSGAGNVGFGYNAGYGNNTGSFNTSIGYEASKGVSNNANSNNTSVGYQALTSITTGGNNIAIGVTPQQFNTTGSHNVGIGQTALRYNQTGINNVAIGSYSQRGASGNSHSNNTSVGFNSLYSVTTGGNNVAVGGGAGYAMTNNASNVIVGRGAFQTADDGENNNTIIGDYAGRYINNNNADHNVLIGNASGQGGTGELKQCVVIGSLAMDATDTNTQTGTIAIGYESLSSLTSGNGNTAVGFESGKAITTGASNTVLGNQALQSLTTGNQNVAIGHSSSLNVSGSNNVSIGYQALTTGTTVSNNVAIGTRALRYNGTGDHNIAIGQEALQSSSGNNFSHCIALGFESQKNATGGNQNVTIGNYSGKEIAGGDYNAFYGYQSGQKTNGNNCTLIGYRAGRNATGSNNTVVGNSALMGEDGSTTGTDNSILGAFAGFDLTTGHSNVLMGRDAGENLTSGYQNIIIGHRAGETATGLQNAVIIGKNAGQAINSGVHGTIAIGYNALKNLTGGQYNTSIGYESGTTIIGGHSNTMIGYQALTAVTSGHENVALGFRSGHQIDTGDSHVLVGNASGTTLTNGRRCTIIGDESDVSASGALNQIVIGQGQTGVADNTAIIGNSAVTDVYMGDNGSAWSTTSDGRLKENVEEWSTGLDAINKLRIVEYNFKEDNPYKYDHKKKRQGIIAQEAIEAIPEMIKDDGEWLSANQEPMIWALVNAVQELTKKVNILETKLNKEN